MNYSLTSVNAFTLQLVMAEVDLDCADITRHRAAHRHARTSLLISYGDARSPCPGPLLSGGTEVG
jgi:hypothetical protein